MVDRTRPSSRSSADLARKVSDFRGDLLEDCEERMGGQWGFNRLAVPVLGIAIKNISKYVHKLVPEGLR